MTGRPLLICYLPVGDPEASAASAAFYTDHGVDVIEAGLPVEDPVLDGPEVTASMQRAIEAGIVDDAAADELAQQVQAAGTPYTVWMSYCADPDPRYFSRVLRSGASAVLLPDAPAPALHVAARDAGIASIPFLNHPPTDEETAVAVSATGRYVMLAAASGVTGERPTVEPGNRELIDDLRTAGVRAPIALGFGISNGTQARSARELGADGVIVGSACVRAARAGAPALSRLLTELREALDD